MKSWKLVRSNLHWSSSAVRPPERQWALFVFVRAAHEEAQIYYCFDEPERTHLGWAERIGDPKLIEIAEAAIAYAQLAGQDKGFEVRSIPHADTAQ